MAKKAETETFEQVYARLEATVARLEEGGLTLDQSIALYEEGMELARRCQETAEVGGGRGKMFKVIQQQEQAPLLENRL